MIDYATLLPSPRNTKVPVLGHPVCEKTPSKLKAISVFKKGSSTINSHHGQYTGMAERSHESEPPLPLTKWTELPYKCLLDVSVSQSVNLKVSDTSDLRNTAQQLISSRLSISLTLIAS
ncbi:uncharacterized protein CLUP02_04559 [Colletotrichum lupini]|uniref:Uncharacterized protein n=1 Tax=Colletotrichum lupini TaxID=145971 RepID=A0A9Q8SKZ9_9PEZI|nr:uncharacterized protein CLUP02_04559 [Colletotrichum lupini]UQC79080.1 hypothetical protein CLUP02_04559 [Colletotrichum lupini]